tara:strand:+ start:181 stop:480 length:300 start_codon:yes stop_codon:yes gene_type:complete
MTIKLSKSSKFFVKKYNIDPSIKHEPNGILLRYFFLNKIKTKQPKIAPKKRIRLSENGPNRLPIAPNNMKSPPPIPSFLYINLKIKFISHNDKYPIKKP